MRTGEADTYTNPVYDGYFADPFVMRISGRYYAFGTGSVRGGLQFEVLTSSDLASWDSLGGALEPPDASAGTDFWAPEVAFDGSRFFMYYSAGFGDKRHQIRVATAEAPEGPYEDTGHILTPDEPFAIDAHPFRDDDGRWYLYYARDFLDGRKVGTAVVVDPLIDMVRLEGTPRTVQRATSEWQLFEAGRQIYDAVYDWYTIEGPFIRKHDGRYYCFFSGGAWDKPNYGVDYAVSDSPLGPFSEAAGDAPSVLRSVPGRVVGPGHNSIVEGPDGRDFIVYHAWDLDRSARRMCIDPLEWGSNGPVCRGPSFTPQRLARRT